MEEVPKIDCSIYINLESFRNEKKQSVNLKINIYELSYIMRVKCGLRFTNFFQPLRCRD